MLSRKKASIYITGSKIWVGFISKTELKLFEIDWDGKDPTHAFQKITKTFQIEHAYGLLGNDISYVYALKIEGENINRETILSQASSTIPEDISNFNFDWKIVTTDKKTNQTIVQVFVIPQNLLNNISYAAEKNNLKLEPLVPVTSILADQTKSYESPHLILWKKQETLAILADQGAAYFAANISTKQDERIKSLEKFARQQLGVNINHAIIQWEHKSTDPDKQPPKLTSNWTTEEMILSPMVYVRNYTKTKGNDENVLEIPILEDPATPKLTTASKESKSTLKIQQPLPQENLLKKRFPPKTKTIILGGIIVAILGIIIGGGLLVAKSASDKSKEVVSPIPSISPSSAPSLTPEPEEIDLTEYKIQVLNGSGVVGEASRVKELIESKGFKDADTGNADSYEYEDTQVSLKEDTPDQVYQTIKNALEDEFTVVRSEDALSENSEFNAVVTIGIVKE